MKTFILLFLTFAFVANSLKPSRYSEWSIQRQIEDFVLNEVTSEVYVAATFLFHLDAELNTVSMFESNEITATNVIVSHESNTGFACSDLTGHCFIFNLSKVSEINEFEGTPFISSSLASFPIDDMDILYLTLRGSQSICFVIADERTGSIAYRLLIYPSFQFTTNPLSVPSLQEQFLGVPSGKPLRRSLLTYPLRDFVYFVNRHIDISEFPLYVMRMCGEEDNSNIRIESLIEVKLTPCVSNKKYPQNVVFGNLHNTYGEVLLVTFTTNELSVDSTVCVYTQLDLENTMNTTIQNCFDGSTEVSFVFPWFNDFTPTPCNFGAPQSTCKLCSTFDTTRCRLSNYAGIPGVELVGYDHGVYGKATALTLLSFDEVDLVFVGNNVGDLYKFQVVNYNNLTLIEDINLSNLLNEAFSQITPTSDFIYASRATLLYRVTLDNCNDYTTCETCVDTVDPVCGYCSLTDTCTRKSDCVSPDLSLRWITDNSTQCLSINSITPSLAQTGENIELTLSISNLPRLQSAESYECVFVSARTPVSRVTTLSGASIAITGPDVPGESLVYCNVSTSFVIANDYEVIDFSLYSTELNQNFSFQEDSFTFYDCSKQLRCESCTDSTAPCFWCIYDNVCTHSGDVCTDYSVEPNQSSTNCPAIINTTGHVHNGDRSIDVLELHTVNAPEPIAGFNYTCIYLYEDNTSYTSDAVWLSEYRTDCDPPASVYTQFNALLVDFYLVWGGSGFEINEIAINVTIFNCTKYTQSCSTCLGFGGEFGCGNCYQNPNRNGEPVCSLRGQCLDTFYNNTQPCPSAQITDFFPKSSLVFGGTFVNITGSDFGGNLDEIEVLVANEPCEILFYDFGTRIDCVTQPSTEGNTGPIVVTVKGIPTQSDSNYTYSLPNITDVSTTAFSDANSKLNTLYGVKEGGTELVISGTNLEIGSERKVFIQDIFPCAITDYGTTSITCETTAINNLETGIVSIRIDGYDLRFQSRLFSYVNLEVSLIEDRFITPAGGFIVRVEVNDVRGLHTPYIEVLDELTDNAVDKPCEGLYVDEVVCESPAYTYSNNMSVYFVVDNLRRDLQGITTAASNPNCTESYISRNNIIIQGMNFHLAKTDDYVITTETPDGVMIPCRIVTIATDQLECNPPEIITGTLTVKIGRSIECTFPVEANLFEQYGIYIVGSSSLFLLIVLTAFPLILSIVVIRHYKRKKVREVKHLLNQYSKLESNIAKECKTGFAELQVEIVDFVQAAETNTIPFTDFQTYVIRLLFTKTQSVEFLSHPPTDPEKYGEEIDTFRKGMKIFQELFNSKEFLIEFIRTLDNNSNLEVNEKSYFASLLMIALHKNLFFVTEILKVLIDDIITKGVTTSRQNIKTLFRSTSIGEKLLSHWLALCMFNFSRGLPGEELYNLYSALKVQINKGPIDAVTGEAKYSLNQDNILRTTFEVKEIEMLCYFGDISETTKLLDCDTIGQAKKKIIDTLNKNMLASEKPDLEDLELIYIKPKEALSPVMKPKHKQHEDDPSLTLVIKNPIYTPGDDTVAREIPTMSKVKQPYLLFRDIDKTSGMDVGWKRINSLRHYFRIFNILIPEQGSLLLVLQSDLRERFPSLYSDIMKRKSVDTPTRIFHFSIPGSSVNTTLERGKVISEVYFTKLLSTKAILQRFIDNMLNSIFPDRIAQQDCPNAIKHLFDYLDDRARVHNITDAEILHTWKNNTVVLRFWVNMLKNPHFLLDIDVGFPVESSLSTIAQGLVDSCSAREEELTKDSPVNKLLFAKDTKICRKRVRKYYEDIQSIHQTQANFNQHLRQMQLTNSPFFVESAVQEIFLQFVTRTSVIGNLMKRLKEQNLETQTAKFIQILNMTSQIPAYE